MGFQWLRAKRSGFASVWLSAKRAGFASLWRYAAGWRRSLYSLREAVAQPLE